MTDNRLVPKFGDEDDRDKFNRLYDLLDPNSYPLMDEEAVLWAIENLYEVSIMLDNMRVAIEKEDNEENLEKTRKKLGIA